MHSATHVSSWIPSQAAFSRLHHAPTLLYPPVACLPLRKCFGKNMKLSYGIMLGLCLNSAWTLLLAGLVLNTSGTVVSGGAGAQYVRHGGEWRGWCSIRQARW